MRVSDTSDRGSTTGPESTNCGYIRSEGASDVVTVTCDPPRVGQYVTLQREANPPAGRNWEPNVMNIGEVVVTGYLYQGEFNLN